MEATHVMEVAQLFLSLVHSWGLDLPLDKVCENQLGLLRPMVWIYLWVDETSECVSTITLLFFFEKIPVSFGVLSKGGYMSLLLPTWQNDLKVDTTHPPEDVQLTKEITPELIRQENLTRLFTARLHWELSTTITSNHLLAMVAMSNTLMSMTMATFIPEAERNKRLHRQSNRPGAAAWSSEEHEEMFSQQQAQIKQGWSLLSTHHCFLLPDKIDALGRSQYFLFEYFYFTTIWSRWSIGWSRIKTDSRSIDGF